MTHYQLKKVTNTGLFAKCSFWMKKKLIFALALK
jgi:hypothetical protein